MRWSYWRYYSHSPIQLSPRRALGILFLEYHRSLSHLVRLVCLQVLNPRSSCSSITTPVSEPSRPFSSPYSHRRHRRIHPPEAQIVTTSAPSTLTTAPVRRPLFPCDARDLLPLLLACDSRRSPTRANPLRCCCCCSGHRSDRRCLRPFIPRCRLAPHPLSPYDLTCCPCPVRASCCCVRPPPLALASRHKGHRQCPCRLWQG